MTITSDQIAAIEARANAAVGKKARIEVKTVDERYSDVDPIAEMIKHSFRDIPALLARVRGLEVENERLRGALGLAILDAKDAGNG